MKKKQEDCSHAWPNMIRYLDQKCMGCGIARTEVEGAKQLEALFEALAKKKKKALATLNDALKGGDDGL